MADSQNKIVSKMTDLLIVMHLHNQQWQSIASLIVWIGKKYKPMGWGKEVGKYSSGSTLQARRNLFYVY